MMMHTGTDVSGHSSDDKEVMKQTVLGMFKNITADKGHAVSDRYVLHNYYIKLDPKLKELFPEAVKELVAEEHVTKKEGAMIEMWTLFLTEKNSDAIY